MKKTNFTNKINVFTLIITMLSITFLNTFVYADDNISVYVDNSKLYMDVSPIILENRTMVPVRAISEAVGCKVEWFGEDQRIVVYSPAGGDPIIVMYLNDPNVTLNTYDGNTGEITGKVVKIDSPPVMVTNRTLVPLRFIAEAIGFSVEWNNASRTVYLFSGLHESDPGDYSSNNGRGDYFGENNNFIKDPYITFMTQDYSNDNIVEIPYLSYDGATNYEIESINRSLVQGIQQIYNTFLENKSDNEWIEIKSYPFTHDNTIQIVVTYCTFPIYGTDGTLFSINYDKVAKKLLTTNDMLQKLGLSKENIVQNVKNLFVPETNSQYVGNVNISGFIMLPGYDKTYTHFLLEVVVENNDAEPWNRFYSYSPELNELTELNNYCLFDPSELDQTFPPLSYNKN